MKGKKGYNQNILIKNVEQQFMKRVIKLKNIFN